MCFISCDRQYALLATKIQHVGIEHSMKPANINPITSDAIKLNGLSPRNERKTRIAIIANDTNASSPEMNPILNVFEARFFRSSACSEK